VPASVVDILQYEYAGVWEAIGVDRGEGHGVRLFDVLGDSIVEPELEGLLGVVWEVGEVVDLEGTFQGWETSQKGFDRWI
jgi:hypothetical protein